MFSRSPQPQATGGGRRNHLSPPNPNVVLFISLFLILMTASFISFTSQVFTPLLVQELKTKHGLRLILLVVIVTVCVFLPINNSENTSINDEHACNNSGGDQLYHHHQQRESKLQPKTPTSKEHKQKSVETILSRQKPSSTAAQKPPLKDKKVRSKRVDHQDGMRSGASSPSPHAGARRSREPAAQEPPLKDKKVRSKRIDHQDGMRSGASLSSPHAGARRSREPAAQKPPLKDKKVRSKRVDHQDVMRSDASSPSPHAGARRSRDPLSPPNGSSCSGDDERMSSRSNSSSFIPLPPPLPPFKIQPHVYTTYVRVHSDNSSRGDSADSMTGSPDVNVEAERFIRNYRKKVKADFEKQGRGKSNPARLRSSKTRRKNEK